MAAAALCCRGPCRTGWLPTLQIVRHAKSVTRHWKAMHFERQKLMAVTEYIAPKPEKCIAPRIKAVTEENGYAKLLRWQVTETFRDSKMIAVCQHNFTPSEEMLLMKHRLRKHNIHVKFFPNEIVRPYLSVSKYKNLLPLFVGCNLMLVSPEIKVKEMLRILKNVPQINLLGACVDNTILSNQGVINYSKLPTMEITQGQVVGTLSLMASQTCGLLQHSSVHLTALLDQYIKQQSSGAGETGKAGEGQAELEPARSSAGL
ncbi:39S ribosomal protein L10, mitochondrial isoform X1 [Mauremys reevesii]|uniref:39S ribosomal protein L10, mitochondrial isoform X1 n=2 Tax=Mauremys reevesii TaxID=260615 RepID=UPI00193F45EA|nr:39S ribosomal protein L10, mitochondrial isoform X1 [Mauremys reevesii]